MIIKTYSYRFAKEILQHKNYRFVYDELIKICEKCPIPKYSGKSKSQKKKDILQQMMNTYFKEAFLKAGWEKEPYATPEQFEDSLRADFRKTFINTNDEKISITLQIEVEFGNVASSYRNYFKFQLSFANEMIDVGILIVPSYHLANRIDSGVANFEKVIREIPSAKLSVTVPILVIGLYEEQDQEWDMKEEGYSLDVLKKSGSKYVQQRKEIIREYIDGING